MNEVNRMCEEMMSNARDVERASLARAAEVDRQAAARGPLGLLARMGSATRSQVTGRVLLTLSAVILPAVILTLFSTASLSFTWLLSSAACLLHCLGPWFGHVHGQAYHLVTSAESMLIRLSNSG